MRRFGLAACVALVGLLGQAGLAQQPAPGHPDAPDGQALFTGQQPLPAHLRNQDIALPPVATRCVNCHLVRAPDKQDGQLAAQSLGPVLDAAFLLTSQPRHGGPATAYAEGSFCRVLRTSVAPSDIVIAQAMPQFDITDAQCQALWHYLTAPRAHAKPQP